MLTKQIQSSNRFYLSAEWFMEASLLTHNQYWLFIMCHFYSFGFNQSHNLTQLLIRIPARLLFLVLCKVTVKLSDVDPYIDTSWTKRSLYYLILSAQEEMEFEKWAQIQATTADVTGAFMSFRKPLIYRQLSWHSGNTCTILSILITTNGFQGLMSFFFFFFFLNSEWVILNADWLRILLMPELLFFGGRGVYGLFWR